MEQLSRHLTKRELLDLLEVTHCSSLAGTDEELKAILLSVEEMVPCRNIFAGLGERSSSGAFQRPIKAVNVSFPEDWIEVYHACGYAAIDPVLRLHFKNFVTQIWSETFQKVRSCREKAFIRHAGEFGLVQGITVGISSRRHSAGSVFSFADPSIAAHPRHRVILEYLVPYLHLAVMRTAFNHPAATPTLSLREREVLAWMKEGKTNWEISKILNISERTVKFHVQNLLLKLQASTRGHAVAIALEQRLIGPS